MPVTLTNQSRALVTVQLRSGDSVHLGPDEISRVVEDVELRENEHVQKLVDRNLVRVSHLSEEKVSVEVNKSGKSARARTR